MVKIYNLYTDVTNYAIKVISEHTVIITIDDATWLTEEDAKEHQKRLSKTKNSKCHLREVPEELVIEYAQMLEKGIAEPDQLHPKKICDLLLAEINDGKIYLEDITGTLGNWLDDNIDTSVPQNVIDAINNAYVIAVNCLTEEGNNQ